MEKRTKPSHRKHRNQVHPSPTSSDALSVLKLLPATILAIAFALSLEDREVLAYMITRSMKTKNPLLLIEQDKKRCNSLKSLHKPPDFKCGCFDCYSSYWFKWDSSPDKDVILQAIEAFEEHLESRELSKKKEKTGQESKLGEKYGVTAVVEQSGSEEKECSSDEVTGNLSHSWVDVNFPACSEEGIARKVLPGVLDLFNSRLWGLCGVGCLLKFL